MLQDTMRMVVENVLSPVEMETCNGEELKP